MGLIYLLDTNIIAEPGRRRPDAAVVRRLERHASASALAAVSWQELLFGYHRLPVSRRKAQVRAYLAQVVALTMPILAYDQAAAAWHARERARLSAAGRPASAADAMMAAVAAVNELTLVTRNTRDFAGFDDLRVENWFELPLIDITKTE